MRKLIGALVKTLESLKSALMELEEKELSKEKRVVKNEGIARKVERSAIPRRQVSATAS